VYTGLRSVGAQTRLAEGCCTAAGIAHVPLLLGQSHQPHLAAVASSHGVQWAQGLPALQGYMPWERSG
jgi:hypothetical protein